MIVFLRFLKGMFKLLIYRVLYVFQIGKSDVICFPDGVFDNKRVIIIGPAETSLTYMSGEDIDKFDFIVRVNKSPLFLEGNESKIGSRTDILYHCFSEDPINGGGRLDFDILEKQENKYISYSYAEPILESVFYKTVLKYKGKRFYRVRKDFFLELKKDYPAKWPTTGLQAVLHLMSCNFKELHITGFTFFRTNYLSGYTTNEINKSNETRKSQIEKYGTHSFEGELELFKKYYKLNRCKDIYMDSFLKELVKEV